MYHLWISVETQSHFRTAWGAALPWCKCLDSADSRIHAWCYLWNIAFHLQHPFFGGGLTPATPMATANSMCQTSNDVGNGIGMFIGSAVASVFWRIQLAVSLESIMRCMLVIGILLMEQWKINAKIYVFRHQNRI